VSRGAGVRWRARFPLLAPVPARTGWTPCTGCGGARDRGERAGGGGSRHDGRAARSGRRAPRRLPIAASPVAAPTPPGSHASNEAHAERSVRRSRTADAARLGPGAAMEPPSFDGGGRRAPIPSPPPPSPRQNAAQILTHPLPPHSLSAPPSASRSSARSFARWPASPPTRSASASC